MKIYRHPDHYDVIDGNELFKVGYTLKTIKKVGVISDKYVPGGTLVQHPMKGLLFPIIALVKKERGHNEQQNITPAA